MEHTLHEKHDQEWEQFFKQYRETASQIFDDAYKFTPEELQQRHEAYELARQKWQDEWGINGTHTHELKRRQTAELEAQRNVDGNKDHDRPSEEEIEDMYKEHLKSEIYRHRPELIIRDGNLHDLYEEHRAIRNHYKELAAPIPAATERRMDKQLAEFRKYWQMEGVNEEAIIAPTLSQEDHENELQSWRNLMTSHGIIEYMYATKKHPDFPNIPEETQKRMLREVDNYHQEIDNHLAAAERLQIDTPLEQEKNEFRQRLKIARMNNGQRPRQKP